MRLTPFISVKKELRRKRWNWPAALVLRGVPKGAAVGVLRGHLVRLGYKLSSCVM